MNPSDPALDAASAKFPLLLAAVLERANAAQLRAFQASLQKLADALDPSEQRVLEAWTGELRPGRLH